MDIRRQQTRDFVEVEMEGCQGVTVARLFVNEGDEEWPCLREFTLRPGGHTADHSHPWFHEIIVKRGILRLASDGEHTELHGDDAVRIDRGEPHQFRNPCHYPISFYCLIPPRGT